MRAVKQQMCAGVYKADHYSGFMVSICMSDFSMSRSVQQSLRRHFAVTQTLTTGLEVVWPAIPSSVKAIYTCCISKYPPVRLETSAAVEKEM